MINSSTNFFLAMLMPIQQGNQISAIFHRYPLS